MRRKHFILSLVFSVFSAVIVLLAAWLPGKYQVPVLMYHAVSLEWHEPLNNVSPSSFTKQMAYLKKHGYHVLSVAQYVEGLVTGRSFPGKTAVITFDDGYSNNFTAAYPVLKEHAFPATIFVEVGRVGLPGRFDWEAAKEMSAHGISIQSHAVYGEYLPDLTREQVVVTITDSKRILEGALGKPVDFLAYPIGGFSEDIKRSVAAAGYKAAFATNRGYDRSSHDLYELKRIRMKDTDGPLQMWAKLSGYYNLFRKTKNPY